MKLIKHANGKKTIKISQQEWTEIGKKAGFWDNIKQVGKGVGQGIKGAWNAGAGIAGIIGDIGKGVSNLVQQIRSRMQQGQVSSQEVGQYKQMIEGMQNDLASVQSAMQQIDQQTAQQAQQTQNLPGISQNPIYNRPIAASVDKPIKLIKKANGKTTIKLTKQEWLNIGKKAGFPTGYQPYEAPDFSTSEECDICGKKFPNKRKMREHRKLCLDESFTDDILVEIAQDKARPGIDMGL